MARAKNNPNFFPRLNPVTLEKQIALLINDPLKKHRKLIRRVDLYQGVQRWPYILVFETPQIDADDPRCEDLLELTDELALGVPRSPFPEQFVKEVYKEASNADSILHEWYIWEHPSGENLPDDLVLKEYHWLLFRQGEPKKRQRRYHKAYDAVKQIAAEMFKENRGITTEEVITSKKILKVAVKPDGKQISKKILREWVQELNPSYRKGRSASQKGLDHQ